ncbi:MAG TPA: hypothetical protein VGH86_10235 [Phenylobacterium sp.]
MASSTPTNYGLGMSEPKSRSWTAVIPVTGIIGFLLVGAIQTGNIFAFCITMFIALACIAGWLLARSGRGQPEKRTSDKKRETA